MTQTVRREEHDSRRRSRVLWLGADSGCFSGLPRCLVVFCAFLDNIAVAGTAECIPRELVGSMTTIRRFSCDDLFTFNNVNMDLLTETARYPRCGICKFYSLLLFIYGWSNPSAACSTTCHSTCSTWPSGLNIFCSPRAPAPGVRATVCARPSPSAAPSSCIFHVGRPVFLFHLLCLCTYGSYGEGGRGGREMAWSRHRSHGARSS